MSKPTALDYVTTEFGEPGNWQAGYHTGIDYRAAVGTPIFATRRGKVKHAGWGGYGQAYGWHVIIRSFHKGRFREHLYAHLSNDKVQVGWRVKAGQQIGSSGETGNTEGAHLHYEERISPFGYYDHVKPILPNWWPRLKRDRKAIIKRMNK
jgi:murein DD-endopeptidase MepM/ murein hydrolase activator NlpD